MANELGIWISVSIFLQKHYWHLMLKQAIYPFIENYRLSGDLHSLRIEFDFQPNENIILSIFISKKGKYSIAESLNKNLMLFFEYQKLHPIDNTEIGNEIFMSYPTNSLQHGLYLPPLNSEYEYVKTLEDCFSKIMIDAMSDDLIDEETTFTLSLYVLLHFHDLMDRDTLVWRKYYHDLSTLLLSVLTNPTSIEVQYSQMSSSLEDIYADVKIKKNLSWISKYDLSIIGIRNKIMDSKQVIVFINHLNFVLFEQLGFSQIYRSMAVTFISKLLNKHSDNFL